MPEKIQNAIAASEEFEIEGFTLKTYLMFCNHTTSERLENAAITDILNSCLWKTRTYMIIVTPLRFQMFRPHENEKLMFSNLFGLNSVFEKLCCVFVTDSGSDCRIPRPAIYLCRCALKNEVYNNSCYSYSMRCK